ncbi:MAG TPA: hypothetical protein VFO41_14995 [Alphaproteobacteria bacterium]|nr:hypothetical protein [Alphaproteobacteria bacterium]
MSRELKDMSSVRHAVKLIDLGDGLVRLVGDIFHERERAARYHMHSYDRDPATNGGPLPNGVTADAYYQPAASRERFNRKTLPEDSFLSIRRRLVVRNEAGKLSFYVTGPAGSVFTPIDCAI